MGQCTPAVGMVSFQDLDGHVIGNNVVSAGEAIPEEPLVGTKSKPRA